MLKRAIDKITYTFTIISCVVFFIVVLIVCANIIGRTAFNHPINGTVEMVQYGALFCAGMVICRTGFEERHIVVSVFIDKYPKRVRALTIAVGKLIGASVFGVLAYLYILRIPESISSGKVTDSFRLPFEYVYAMMVFCFAAGALVFFYQFLVHIHSFITNTGASDGPKTIDTGEGQIEL
jgi:TRAP-type C4-dicarboxylate transport system permease small subunit